MSERYRPVPPKSWEQDMSAGDGEVVERSAEAKDMLARFVVVSRSLEEAESKGLGVEAVKEVEQRAALSRRQLSDTLLYLGEIPAYTPKGALARVNTARGYFAEFPVEDPGGRALLRVILADIERVWERRQEPPLKP